VANGRAGSSPALGTINTYIKTGCYGNVTPVFCWPDVGQLFLIKIFPTITIQQPSSNAFLIFILIQKIIPPAPASDIQAEVCVTITPLSQPGYWMRPYQTMKPMGSFGKALLPWNDFSRK
jgi:hypothetical protein